MFVCNLPQFGPTKCEFSTNTVTNIQGGAICEHVYGGVISFDLNEGPNFSSIGFVLLFN